MILVRRRCGSMALYLAPAQGLPVFTPIGAPGIARFFGPTGGYLLAYPAAAYLAGTIARHPSPFARRVVAGLAGIAVIYLGGIAQLSVLNMSVVRAVQLGVTPFAALDIVKVIVAAAITGTRSSRSGR